MIRHPLLSSKEMRQRVQRYRNGRISNPAGDELKTKESQWNERRIFLGCLAFRLISAFVLQTSFNPDEYWQSVEVAHRIVFGYGHLTWEWSRGIRSYVHPLIFAGLYKIFQLVRLDSRWLVMKAPRLLQALFAAAADLYLFLLSKHCLGERAAQWTIFCQLCNWFTFYCMVRTFSNCLETVLTVTALYYWMVGRSNSNHNHSSLFTSRQVALCLAALSCVMRPTSAIFGVYIGVIELLKTDQKVRFLMEVLIIGLLTLGASSLVDRWMYGQWVLVPLNFLRFNLLASGGDYYGTHPWHWYFSQGFPAMMLTFLPLSVLGMWWAKQWQLAGLIGWVLSLYSFLGHKEFRFVLPVLPLGLMFAGHALARIQMLCQKPDEEPKKGHQKPKKAWMSCYWLWYRAMVLGLLVTNIPTALYLSLVHQRGNEAVMHFLSEEIVARRVESVTFLMPCHSTPYYSFLHANITMRFLDCTPSNEVGYVDESDRFLANPGSFVHKWYKDSTQLPSHLVLYDSVEHMLLPFLKENGYKRVSEIFHAHLPVDHGLQRYVLVYRRVENESLCKGDRASHGAENGMPACLLEEKSYKE